MVLDLQFTARNWLSVHGLIGHILSLFFFKYTPPPFFFLLGWAILEFSSCDFKFLTVQFSHVTQPCNDTWKKATKQLIECSTEEAWQCEGSHLPNVQHFVAHFSLTSWKAPLDRTFCTATTSQTVSACVVVLVAVLPFLSCWCKS